jgi:hypothetical protein
MNFQAMLRAANALPILYPEANGGDEPTNRTQRTTSALRAYAIGLPDDPTFTAALAAARVPRRRAKAWGTRMLREMLPRDRRMTGPVLAMFRARAGR